MFTGRYIGQNEITMFYYLRQSLIIVGKPESTVRKTNKKL